MVFRWSILRLFVISLLIAAELESPRPNRACFQSTTVTSRLAKPPRRSSEEARFEGADQLCFRAPRCPRTHPVSQPEPADAFKSRKARRPLRTSRDSRFRRKQNQATILSVWSHQPGSQTSSASASTKHLSLESKDEAGPLQQISCHLQRPARETRRKRQLLARSSRGRSLTFAVVSGSPAFDPSISIYEPFRELVRSQAFKPDRVQ